jgi:hypothetical protein
VPSDSAATCAGICHGIGTTLSAVVVMANNVGCVCNPPGAPAAHVESGRAASVAGGVAAVLAAEEQQRQAQQQPVR